MGIIHVFLKYIYAIYLTMNRYIFYIADKIILMAKKPKVVYYRHYILQESGFKILNYSTPKHLCCRFLFFGVATYLFVKYSEHYINYYF